MLFTVCCYIKRGPIWGKCSEWLFWYAHPYVQIVTFLHVFSITTLAGQPFWREINELWAQSRAVNLKLLVKEVFSDLPLVFIPFTSFGWCPVDAQLCYAVLHKVLWWRKSHSVLGFVSAWLWRAKRYTARDGKMRGGKMKEKEDIKGEAGGLKQLISRSWLIDNTIFPPLF